MILMIYSILGMLYWFINAFIRKVDTMDDWFLPLFWVFLWPFAAVAWFIILIQYLLERIKSKKL